ncbi:TPA: hypothetical protein ACGOON_000503 [Streptococcus suis]
MKWYRLALLSSSLLMVACLTACAVKSEQGTATSSSQQVTEVNAEEAQKFTSQHSSKIVSKEELEGGGGVIAFEDETQFIRMFDSIEGEYYMLYYPSGCTVTYFVESESYIVATDEYEGAEKSSEAKGQVGQYSAESGYTISFANDGTLTVDLQGNFIHQTNDQEQNGNIEEAEGRSYVDSLLNKYGIPNLAFYETFVKEAVADAKTYFTDNE